MLGSKGQAPAASSLLRPTSTPSVHLSLERRQPRADRPTSPIRGLARLTVAVLSAAPVWAQGEEVGSSNGDFTSWLAGTQELLADPTARRFAAYIGIGILALWLLSRLPRLLGTGTERGAAGPLSRAENRREARRAARRGDHLQSGRFYEAAEAWGDAAEAFERGQAFAQAAALWERLNQPVKAARLYEQGNDSLKAAELYSRLGNPSRAAALFQKGGHDIKAAQAYERAGEGERAVELYVKHEVFDRAGEILSKLGQPGRAAELLERGLRRLVAPGAELMPETVRARQDVARRCGVLYVEGGQPAKAAAVLREHGLEIEAADYYCQAGDWKTGLDLFLRHRQYERAIAACQAQGAEDRIHIVEGERLVAEGLEREAAREFEAAGAWWRAVEMYERLHDYPRAAGIYAEHGDEERAAEMYAAAGEPALAAGAFERVGKLSEAAGLYRQAGALQDAARCLQVAGDFYGAGMLLIETHAVDEAVTLLQQVGPESEWYLEAAITLGDLFLQRQLYGPAREKFEKAASLRPIAPDFVHPTYQLATIAEQQGDLKTALMLFEKVMAEQMTYLDVQSKIAALRERLAQASPVVSGGEATQILAPPSQRYRPLKELGRGGMGIVYLAEDTVLQRPVAYKILPEAIREDERALEQFLREARIAASLQHQNIVTIFDAGQSGNDIYIAMEYVEGHSLQQILDETPILPLPRGVGVFRQACLGLSHAHKHQIVHRDIKPANMMITPSGVVKLMDFGLAAVITKAIARVTTVRGTPYYMAPEQILGQEISALSDQYSLGCTLYHMVTGRPPFVEGDILFHHIHTAPVAPRERNGQVPVWLSEIILKTLRKEQAKRFPSVALLLQELDRCLVGTRGAGSSSPPGHASR